MDDLLKNAQLSAENKQRLRDLYEKVSAGKEVDPATIFAEDVVVYEPALFPYGGVYRGFDGQQELGKGQLPVIDRSHVEILGLYADGAHVISKLRVGLKGTEHRLLISEHVTYEAGKIIEMRVFVYDEPDAPVAKLFPQPRRC